MVGGSAGGRRLFRQLQRGRQEISSGLDGKTGGHGQAKAREERTRRGGGVGFRCRSTSRSSHVRWPNHRGGRAVACDIPQPAPPICHATPIPPISTSKRPLFSSYPPSHAVSLSRLYAPLPPNLVYLCPHSCLSAYPIQPGASTEPVEPTAVAPVFRDGDDDAVALSGRFESTHPGVRGAERVVFGEEAQRRHGYLRGKMLKR